jgi:hypothetical protein
VQVTHDSKSSSQRLERVISHALVELRRNKWWPFGVQSAVLLDVSAAGFKIEFTGNATCQAGDSFWMEIPLAPFGITSPQSMTLKVVIKWFDPEKMRVGGVFESMEKSSELYLGQIIEKVKEQVL